MVRRAGLGGVMKHRYVTQQNIDHNKVLLYLLSGVGVVIIFAALALALSSKTVPTVDPNLLLLKHPHQVEFLGEDGAELCTTIDFPPQPWVGAPSTALSSLQPYISESTVNFHYNFHQKGYVTKLVSAISASKSVYWPKKPAESIVTRLVRTLPHSSPEYKLAAQVFNHALYFSLLAPSTTETGVTSSAFDEAIKTSGFSTREDLLKAMKQVAVSHFGSGWVWLLYNKSSSPPIVIVDTHDARTPLDIGNSVVPLLVCDVWEHAYYLDRQNRRDEYFDNWAKVINWSKVSQRFSAAVVEKFGTASYPDFS